MGMQWNLPVAFLSCAVVHIGTASAASLSVQSEASVPTQHFSPVNANPAGSSEVLAWIAFAKAVIADARPMHDWERQDADEFFWSQFQ